MTNEFLGGRERDEAFKRVQAVQSGRVSGRAARLMALFKAVNSLCADWVHEGKAPDHVYVSPEMYELAGNVATIDTDFGRLPFTKMGADEAKELGGIVVRAEKPLPAGYQMSLTLKSMYGKRPIERAQAIVDLHEEERKEATHDTFTSSGINPANDQPLTEAQKDVVARRVAMRNELAQGRGSGDEMARLDEEYRDAFKDD